MSDHVVGPARQRVPIRFADDELAPNRVPLRYRALEAAEAGLMFALRWGIALVLLGVIVRFTLTELVTPPLLRLVMTDLALAKEQAKNAAEGTAKTIGFLELLIDRGVLPKGQVVGTLPKAEWSKPFVLNDKEPVK